MKKSYKVAEHVFSLTLPDTCGLWEYLTQYEPFISESDEGELYTLELVESLGEAAGQVVALPEPEPDETLIRIYRQEDGWMFEMAVCSRYPVCARMKTGSDFSHGRLELLNHKVSNGLFGINNALMLLYAFRTAPLNTLEMHSSVICNSGRAYLFLGRSGAGKSTHSRQWLQYVEGSELMNDDNPIVRVWPDGRVVAYGSPWSGKTPCYRNVKADAAAFVQIVQHPQNIITKMSALEAYATLYSSCSGFKSDSAMSDCLHDTMEKVVMNVPFFTLRCRADEEAARVCSAEIKDRK